MSLLALAQPAAAARSEWSEQAQSRLRLLLTTPNAGQLSGGVDIELEPGWHTYWRNPGDAGVPPALDFSRSENVASVEVLYPMPERYQDEGGVSLVYRDEIVFPLVVKPAREGEPVTLRLRATIGVCREICLPVSAEAEVEIATNSPADPLSEDLLQRFGSRVPGLPKPGKLEVLGAVARGDALDIDVRMPESTDADLFVDPPQGWYLGQPTFVSRSDDISHYKLTLNGAPKGVDVVRQRFRFVAVAGDDAIESTVVIGRTLDKPAGSAKPSIP